MKQLLLTGLQIYAYASGCMGTKEGQTGPFRYPVPPLVFHVWMGGCLGWCLTQYLGASMVTVRWVEQLPWQRRSAFGRGTHFHQGHGMWEPSKMRGFLLGFLFQPPGLGAQSGPISTPGPDPNATLQQLGNAWEGSTH